MDGHLVNHGIYLSPSQWQISQRLGLNVEAKAVQFLKLRLKKCWYNFNLTFLVQWMIGWNLQGSDTAALVFLSCLA